MKTVSLYALLIVATVVVAGYMVTASDRPTPPYVVASLD